jgi:poly(hydroxyalkanoate) depolymerase family esterase
MKLPLFTTLPAANFKRNADDISRTIERALSSAGLPTQSGPMLGVTETIRHALASVGLGNDLTMPRPDVEVIDPLDVIDIDVRVVDSLHAPAFRAATHTSPKNRKSEAGQFVSRSFSNGAGTRIYKLYLPLRAPSAPMPLLVMLHGCTQSADDFAAGTQMNRLAEAHGFIVVYPEQPSTANMSKCWSWFNPQDQSRDRGEPSLIAGITREVMASHDVDPRRVFVAGLSAGAAMAVVMGESYPELYAAVGSHSGLPYGSAHDIPSAMATMKGSRRSGADINQPGVGVAKSHRLSHAVPTIVFQGDRDHTVKHTNSVSIVDQACKAYSADLAGIALSKVVEPGESVRGQTFSRTIYCDAAGHARIESWLVHGAGHAWCGGDASGSFTDRSGPDASAEMVRFFLAQSPAAPT